MGVAIAHLSDLHFGVHCDLAQIEALERFLPEVEPDAVAISGDLSQRARHGEFQAAHLFVQRVRHTAPVLVVPGNHDVQWWESPYGLRGTERLYAKYRAYFGPELAPVLELPGVVLAGAVSAHGLAWGSTTARLRDLAVKGHLPAAETERVRALFARQPAGVAKVLVMHHNVLPGKISGRMGLADWQDAQRRLQATGADVVLCGHDHEERADQVDGRLAVSAAGTHSSRMRGGRPSVFNLVRIEGGQVHIQHFRWDRATRRFGRGELVSFARLGPEAAVVSAAGAGAGDPGAARPTATR